MSLKKRSVLLILIIVGILAAIPCARMLPVPHKNTYSSAKNRYSGVLRLWICEKSFVGSKALSSWLIGESTNFEKKNDGIYIQITPVSEETLSRMSLFPAIPPDMIVVTPDVHPDFDDLIEIDAPDALRSDLHGYSDTLVPVALGAGAWAVKADGFEGTLSGKKLMFPKDADPVSALNALCCDISPASPSGSGYGIDLSLPVPDEKPRTPVSGNNAEIVPAPGSAASEHAVNFFLNGECDALFVAAKELRLLKNADNAPEYEIIPVKNAYACNAALFGIVRGEGARQQEKQAVCEMFLQHLLSVSAQQRLKSTGAYSAVEGVCLYASDRNLAPVEAALSVQSLSIPRPGADFGAREAAALAGCLSRNGSAQAHIDILRKENRIFPQNPR